MENKNWIKYKLIFLGSAIVFAYVGLDVFAIFAASAFLFD